MPFIFLYFDSVDFLCNLMVYTLFCARLEMLISPLETPKEINEVNSVCV